MSNIGKARHRQISLSSLAGLSFKRFKFVNVNHWTRGAEYRATRWHDVMWCKLGREAKKGEGQYILKANKLHCYVNTTQYRKICSTSLLLHHTTNTLHLYPLSRIHEAESKIWWSDGRQAHFSWIYSTSKKYWHSGGVDSWEMVSCGELMLLW